MSFRDIRRLRGLGKENFDTIKEKMVDGIRRLLKEMDNYAIFGARQVIRDQEIFTSIILSLALPDDYVDLQGALDDHLRQAAVDIEADLREYWRSRGRQDEADEGKRPPVLADIQPDPAINAVAPTPGEQDSPGIQVERRETGESDIAPADFVKLPSYMSPYVKYMIQATLDIGPGITELRKKEVRYHLESHWPIDALGRASEHQLEMMSMFIRSPAAHQVKA